MVDNNVILMVLKIFFIFLAVLFTSANIFKLYMNNSISSFSMTMQAVGITGVIVCYTMF